VSEWWIIWAKGLPHEADLQNQAIRWLRKECSSLGGGRAVRFPRIWMSSGECRLKPSKYHFSTILGRCGRLPGRPGWEFMKNQYTSLMINEK
jgi:hypothetical protein